MLFRSVSQSRYKVFMSGSQNSLLDKYAEMLSDPKNRKIIQDIDSAAINMARGDEWDEVNVPSELQLLIVELTPMISRFIKNPATDEIKVMKELYL